MSQEKTLEEALDWFNDKVSSTVSSYRNNAMKHLRAISDRVEELKTAAHRFDYSDLKDPDVYQNYSTTIYNNTLEAFGGFNIPENITYNIIDDFNSDLKNKINSYVNMLAKYLSWLKRDRSYKTKVKNLDRALTRLKEEVFNFENKTMVSYAEIIKYEKVSDDIESLIQNVDRKKFLEDEIESHAEEVEQISKTIEKKEKELSELQNHPGFQQLEKNRKDMDHIEITIANKVSEIKKLCNKVLRASDTRKINLDDSYKDMMKTMIKDPLGLFIKEGEGYRGVKAMLRELKEISKEPAIQMKKEKLQRAYDNIDEILNDEILELQKRAKFIVQQNEAISTKFREMQLDIKIKKLEEEIDNLKIDRNRITLPLRRERDEIEAKITSISKSVEKRIVEFTDKSLKLLLYSSL
ncbi:MAG: hypothetical protein ACFFDS_04210 [Candidatus Thorarchaeota archaeon]